MVLDHVGEDLGQAPADAHAPLTAATEPVGFDGDGGVLGPHREQAAVLDGVAPHGRLGAVHAHADAGGHRGALAAMDPVALHRGMAAGGDGHAHEPGAFDVIVAHRHAGGLVDPDPAQRATGQLGPLDDHRAGRVDGGHAGAGVALAVLDDGSDLAADHLALPGVREEDPFAGRPLHEHRLDPGPAAQDLDPPTAVGLHVEVGKHDVCARLDPHEISSAPHVEPRHHRADRPRGHHEARDHRPLPVGRPVHGHGLVHGQRLRPGPRLEGQPIAWLRRRHGLGQGPSRRDRPKLPAHAEADGAGWTHPRSGAA